MNKNNLDFDWYQISLLSHSSSNNKYNNTSSPTISQIQKFNSIIQNGNISKNISKVPTSYRLNLLKLFQSYSKKLKKQTTQINAVHTQLMINKNIIADKIQIMEVELENSKGQLVQMKGIVNEKKKISKKLKEKIENMKKNKANTQVLQAYFCPYCSRNDFINKEMFVGHMFTEHQHISNQNQQYNTSLQSNSLSNNQSHALSSASQAANNELKQFIMTLKDKEMQMMKLILEKKKNLQTQQLQKIYQNQLHSYTMKNRSQPEYFNNSVQNNQLKLQFYQNQSYQNNDEEQPKQLKGQSQFLFYQKSEMYKKQVEIKEKQYSLRRQIEEKRRKELKYHPYYDVFKDLEENRSENVDEREIMGYEGDRNEQYMTHHKSNNINKTQKRNNNTMIHQNYKSTTQAKGLVSYTKPYNHHDNNAIHPLKISQNKLMFQQQQIQIITNPQFVKPSITDRLKQEEQKYNDNRINHNMTIYSTTSQRGRHSSKIAHIVTNSEEYVFNCGALIEDQGGDSDYEDYFGQKSDKNSSNYCKSNQNQSRQSERKSVNFNFSKKQNSLSYNENNSNALEYSHDQQQKQHQNQVSMIQDQQIKLSPSLNMFLSRNQLSRQQISQLLSPLKSEDNSSFIPSYKQNNYPSYNNSNYMSHNHNYSSQHHHNNKSSYHDKSSQIVDLSDSFSRNNISLSKDQQTINLSDLKLSKLQKKRAQQIMYNKDKINENQNHNSKLFAKKVNKYPQNDLISQQKPFNLHMVYESKNILKNQNAQKDITQKQSQIQQIQEPKFKYLSQFERKLQNIPIYSYSSNYINNQDKQNKQIYELSSFYKKSPVINASINNVNHVNAFNQINNKNEREQKDPNEMLIRQFYQEKQPNLTNQLMQKSKAISPQTFFVNQMKNQLQKHTQNLPSQITQTPSFLNNNENTSSRKSIKAKRLQRHDELLSDNPINTNISNQPNSGLLNEFLKKQFNQPSYLDKLNDESKFIINNKPNNALQEFIK